MTENFKGEEEEALPDPDLSPLRSLVSEMHEIYEELRLVGFTESVATGIVAQMVSDAMGYKADDNSVTIRYEDGNDDYDESDDDNERGLE